MGLERTAAALAEYDASPEAGDPYMDGPRAKAVGVAYGLDTADRNNPETCAACVRPGAFVRRMVDMWRGGRWF